MSGYEDSPWEGAHIQISIFFDNYYPTRPPHVYFCTIPFHPNSR